MFAKFRQRKTRGYHRNGRPKDGGKHIEIHEEVYDDLDGAVFLDFGVGALVFRSVDLGIATDVEQYEFCDDFFGSDSAGNYFRADGGQFCGQKKSQEDYDLDGQH